MAIASESDTASAETQEPHWLIWDGECGFCRRSIGWLAQRDTEHHFRITTYQSCPTPPMTPALREEAARAVQVIANAGHIVSGGRAVLFALEQVGWHPRLARIASHPPFIWLVSLGYRVVANNRQFFSRIFFRSQTDGPTC
jgi:predicted DCC family thiol-disulfide oxidoreductase YuxK